MDVTRCYSLYLTKMSPFIGKLEILCHIVVHFTIIVNLTVPFSHLVHVDDFYITKPVTMACKGYYFYWKKNSAWKSQDRHDRIETTLDIEKIIAYYVIWWGHCLLFDYRQTTCNMSWKYIYEYIHLLSRFPFKGHCPANHQLTSDSLLNYLSITSFSDGLC